MTEDGTRPLAGSGILHPVVIAAIVLLIVNDHFLKETWGHPLTGKLSDVAGLAFFPLLMVTLVELSLALLGRYTAPSRLTLIAATLATGVCFSAVQISAPAADAYEITLGVLQRPVDALGAIGEDRPALLQRVTVTQDVTDLAALPALLVALRIGLSRDRRAR